MGLRVPGRTFCAFNKNNSAAKGEERMATGFRRRLIFGLIAFAAGIVSMNTSAIAADQSGDEGVYTLGEVVVTAKQGVAQSVGTVREVGQGESRS
jgi:hypothetical protein